jgi:hypothetical protein
LSGPPDDQVDKDAAHAGEIGGHHPPMQICNRFAPGMSNADDVEGLSVPIRRSGVW